MKSALLFALVACSAACSQATLAGTQIPATDSNKAVLRVFSDYHTALENRDPTALLALAAPNYYDTGDTTRGVSPTDYASLQKKLAKDFDKVNGLRLEATIKDIQVD